MRGLDVPAGKVKVDQSGYNVSIEMRGGECIQTINGRDLVLHPWVGVQLESYLVDGHEWNRKETEKYEPIEVLGYLRRLA